MARTYGESTYGDSTYGVTNYLDGEATPAGVASLTSSANAIFNNEQNVDPIAASASVTAAGQRVLPTGILIDCFASVDATAVAVYSVAVTVDGESATDAQAFYTAKGESLISTAGTMTAAAREKWEPINKIDEIWTEIA